jgi:protein-S-isoprenylcysteine O-methyltransferase Ste14
MSVLLIRTAALLMPAMVVFAAIISLRPANRRATAAFVGFIWNATTLFALNVLALRLGWWTFNAEGGLLAGVPMDLLLGWSVMWSAIPVLVLPRVRFRVIISALVLVDLIYMPLLQPVLVLGPHWLIGEAIAVGAALVPGLTVARWTEEDRHVHLRNAMLMFIFASLSLAIIPLAILQVTHGRVPAWSTKTGILAQLLVFPTLCGITAVQEFSTRGCGTPLPYDPPKRLVTSGIYAYIRNPMQLSSVVLMAGVAILLQSPWTLLACFTAIVYSAGLAYWDEVHCLEGFANWKQYRDNVALWLPRWRPYVERPANLYIARGCGICQSMQPLIERLRPIGLTVVAAEEHPTRDLTRITYRPSDGSPEVDGIHALARALEHVNFAFAYCGFFMRLPGISMILQIVIDAMGGEPRLIRRKL